MHRRGFPSLARVPLILGTVAICALAPAALALEWKPFGLQGTVIRSLAATPDLLCAGTEEEGVHCLELGVANSRWRSAGLRGRTVLWLWVDPLGSDVRFAAVDSPFGEASLYRTLDGGRSWEAIENLPAPIGGSPRVFVVDGVPGTGTVVAGGGHIWRTDDGGDSWQLLSAVGGLYSLEIAPTDPDTIWVGGETLIMMGFTMLSRDGGLSWNTVWDSREIGDNQTSSVSAHPDLDGLVLSGHEGFILRTGDHGESFEQVLMAPARFFIDWDGGHPLRVYGAGSPNDQLGLAFVSRDLGITWTDVSGLALPSRIIFRLEADDQRLGVAYAATDDGVYRFYGGGLPLCLDTLDGLDALRLWPGECAPIPGRDASSPERGPAMPAPTSTVRAPAPVTPGDAIAFDPDRVSLTGSRVNLGEVECLMDGEDLALVTLDPPEPAPGRAIAFLVRYEGNSDYGRSSDGLRRLPSAGDCP